MRMRSLVIAGSLVLASVVASPMTAFAAGNEAAAQALFEEAQKLVKEKKFAEACPKFAESNRLDRGAGTLIHLADCYEKNKQTASAWATWKDAASAAQAINRQDWQKLATDRSGKLEPKLAKLTIKVDSPVDKMEVSKDGAPFTQATWGTPLPVDVGPHTIEATAPGYKTFKTTANVSKDGEKLDVVIPKLEVDPAAQTVAQKPDTTTKPAEPAKPATKKDEEDGSGQRAIGFIVGGVGIAGLAVGGVTGLMAMSKNNEAKDKCPGDGACANKEGVDANDSAKSLGLVSTIAFGAGAALLIGGAVLIFTAPKGPSKEARAVKVLPTATASGGGLFLSGSF